jgi:hypothetical protein
MVSSLSAAFECVPWRIPVRRNHGVPLSKCLIKSLRTDSLLHLWKAGQRLNGKEEDELYASHYPLL